jgi:hypothetical protein
VDSQFLSDITHDYKEAKSVQFDQFPPWLYVAKLDKHVIKRSRDDCFKFAYIQHSSGQRINAIIIDIDDDTPTHIDFIRSILPVEVASIVGRYQQGNFDYVIKPHIRINLSSPVYKNKPKAMLYLKSIVESIQAKFTEAGFKKVDKCPPLVTKNPFNSAWKSYINENQVQYSLKELSEKLNVKRENKTSSNVVQFKPREIVKKEGVNYAGRNEEVFHEARILSYQLHGKYKTQHELYLAVLEICKSVNANFSKQLNIREVADTAKSISDFVFNRYTPGRSQKEFNVGAAKKYIKPEYGLKTRQQIGALYSNKVRANKAIETLSEAISKARESGIEITKKNIKELSGLSYPTIRKYWNEAQNDNVIRITDADYKLNYFSETTLYQEEGLITKQKPEKVKNTDYKVQNPTKSGLNVISNEKNNIDVDENTYSTDENNQIIEEKEDRYDYRTYLHIVLNMNDDDDCPF